jgi:hypothetical protein
MLPTVQKFLGRVFAHREQECPSAKGSVSREVNKSRKAGIHEPRMLSLEPVSAYPEPVLGPRRLPDPLPWPLAPPITANGQSCHEHQLMQPRPDQEVKPAATGTWKPTTPVHHRPYLTNPAI